MILISPFIADYFVSGSCNDSSNLKWNKYKGGKSAEVPAQVNTDRLKYATGQVVHVFGQAFDNNGNPYNGSLRIEVTRTHYTSFWCYTPLEPSKQEVSKSGVILLYNGSYYYDFTNDESGRYLVNVSKGASGVSGFATITVVNTIYSQFNLWLLTAGAFFLGLIFLLLVTSYLHKDDKNAEITKSVRSKIEHKDALANVEYGHVYKDDNKKHLGNRVNLELQGILRFLCISGIVFSIISAFIYTDVEIGTYSPIGLVIRHNLNSHSVTELDRNGNPVDEWVINIGGSWKNNFSSGVYVPVYVVIFGILGGYLRYLYKAASKEEYHETTRPDDEERNEPDTDIFLRVTLGEFAQVVLSPLLAIITWFLLTQGQSTNNIYLLAAVSFTVGLITRDIIRALIKFVIKLIPIENK